MDYYCRKCGVDLNKYEQERKGLPVFVVDSCFRYEEEKPNLCIDCFHKWLEAREDTLQRFLGEKTSSFTFSQSYKEGYVYLLKCEDVFKIGFSKDVDRRVSQLDTRPYELEFVAKYYSDIAYDIEHTFHKENQSNRIKGEWYKFDFDIISGFEDIVVDIEKRLKGEE